ncbi:RidA family protein [Labrys wisconsinensis]|uniref:Enamine deaminase RidA (YjgF/YER057c/UK114 family) n=1 Tax=Labrys wisconsinensis TaxID=425677 RepID=A0ABU0JLL8_9HYPH|nr:RidA family protein [Labrys wisconsinensis]MDQ0474376.1 enamine deaminase RidA (YjgF/YER057c/UK114 family) [Labrys wisconsinensis]
MQAPTEDERPASARDPYARLHALGLSLPAAPTPIANFRPAIREGRLVFLSGQGPTGAGGQLHTGKVGADVGMPEAYAHARLTGLNLIAVMHDALGDLKRVRRVVKIFGMVNATPDFAEHSAVIDGCSDLFFEVFGDAGRHARTAVGVSSLPRRITVEIEAVIAVQ